MKTTVEMSDHLFRAAKSRAAEQGISLKEFFTEAVRRQLSRPDSEGQSDKPWLKAFGGLRHLHAENRRIERVIAAEFEQIDPEDWK